MAKINSIKRRFKINRMKIFTTEIHAKDALTGEMKKFIGENIEANTFNEAQRKAYENGKGYLIVSGILIDEIPVSNEFVRNVIDNL